MIEPEIIKGVEIRSIAVDSKDSAADVAGDIHRLVFPEDFQKEEVKCDGIRKLELD